MNSPYKSWKRTSGLMALVLVGLLAGQAARAEVMTFETSLVASSVYAYDYAGIPAAYQPIPYVTCTYQSAAPTYLYNGIFAGTAYMWDHTTTSYGGTHYFVLAYNSGTVPFTFNQPVCIPSLFLSTWGGSSTNVTINAYSDAAGTQLLTNFVFASHGIFTWTQCTNLASLGTNIMLLTVADVSGSAWIDDITVWSTNNYGTLNGIAFQSPSAALQPGTGWQPVILAQYASVTNTVTTWATFKSTDPHVATIPEQGGAVTANAPGTTQIIAYFGGLSVTNTLTVTTLPTASGLTTFNGAYSSQPNGTLIPMPATYQTPYISWANAGLFNGGPDHTVGVLGNNNWAACQYPDQTAGPQIYTFNQAFSLPSLWLTTMDGAGDGSNDVTIIAYSDAAGTVPLGTNVITTPIHGGPGYFQWVQCTNFNSPTYNGQIMSLQISAPGNAVVDDMLLAFNYGTLTNLSVTLPLTSLDPLMSRQLTLTGQYDSGTNANLAVNALYSTSDPTIATVTPYGRVQAVGGAGGTATITAVVLTNGVQGLTNGVSVTVNPLPANTTMVTFDDGGWMPGMYNWAPIATANYQPVPGVTITWPYGANLFGVMLWNDNADGLVVDHTTGQVGNNTLVGDDNNYVALIYPGYSALATNGVYFSFSQPVGIPSLWLATRTPTNNWVVVRAWSDAAGTSLIYSNTVPVSSNAWTFSKFTDLASFGNTIQRVSFVNPTICGFDDMMVTVVAGAGSLTNLTLELSTTNLVPTMHEQATVLGYYQNQSGGSNVTSYATYSSSAPSVVTVSAGGLVTAVSPGSALISASLSNITNSVAVTVSPPPSLQYSVSGSGASAVLTFSWPTSAPAGFTLVTSPVLGPGAVWTVVSGTPTVVGSNYQLPVPVNPAARAAFYQLLLQQ